MLENAQATTYQTLEDGEQHPAPIDMSMLNKKEREVLVEYMGEGYTGLMPRLHDTIDLAKSDGEKRFDTITYKGLGWLGTAVLGIYLSHEFKEGWGKPYFHRATEHLAPYYQKLMRTTEQTAREAVQSGLVHAGLVAGGSIPVYPIKKLEDNKATIVAHFDHQINEKRRRRGDAPTEAELAVQRQTQERLASKPKQTWGSLLAGRAAGVSTVFFTAIFLARGKDKKILEKVASEVTDNKKLQSLGVITALDVGYSFISEEVLYYTTRLYEQLQGKRNRILKAQQTNPIEVPEKPQQQVTQVALASNANQPQHAESMAMGVSA